MKVRIAVAVFPHGSEVAWRAYGRATINTQYVVDQATSGGGGQAKVYWIEADVPDPEQPEPTIAGKLVDTVFERSVPQRAEAGQ